VLSIVATRATITRDSRADRVITAAEASSVASALARAWIAVRVEGESDDWVDEGSGVSLMNARVCECLVVRIHKSLEVGLLARANKIWVARASVSL
jgi:hypothetical protein